MVNDALRDRDPQALLEQAGETALSPAPAWGDEEEPRERDERHRDWMRRLVEQLIG